jgi:hypothetical protein
MENHHYKNLRISTPSDNFKSAAMQKINVNPFKHSITTMRFYATCSLTWSKKYSGLEVPDLYIEQGIAHITCLIGYSVTKKHSTGLLLRHSCEAFKLEMGCSGSIFSLPSSLACLAMPGWVSLTWLFAKQFNILIHNYLPEFEAPRAADCLLIPTFAGLGFASNQLVWLNQCRLYLRVSWLSKLCTADGTRIEV